MLTSSSYSWPKRVVIDTSILGAVEMGIGRAIQCMSSKLLFDKCDTIVNCTLNTFGQGMDICGEGVFQVGKFTATMIPKGFFYAADWLASGKISAADESLKIQKFFTLIGNDLSSFINFTTKGSWGLFTNYGVPAMGTAAKYSVLGIGTAAKAGFDGLWWTVSSRLGIVTLTCASIYLAVKARSFLSEFPVPKDMKISF
ncbi:MAG: hypothetical protein K1000chlam3_01197 [Chlamydiae bacterium]|nr:hypothetical protein [Chlamydiota bacterium]